MGLNTQGLAPPRESPTVFDNRFARAVIRFDSRSQVRDLTELESALRRRIGIVSLEFNFIVDKVQIVYDPGVVRLEDIRRELERYGEGAAQDSSASRGSPSNAGQLTGGRHGPGRTRSVAGSSTFHAEKQNMFVNYSLKLCLRNLPHILTSVVGRHLSGGVPL